VICFDTRAEIRELLAKTTMSERAIAAATGSDKRTVGRVRVSEQIERPEPHKAPKQGKFVDLPEDEIYRRAAELRALWPKSRLRAAEGVVEVDYSGSWNLVDAKLS
jgi:transposase